MSTPTTAPTGRRRPPPKFHRVTVAAVTSVTPLTRRITFTGDDLADYPNDGPATHCKLLLPAPGEAAVRLLAPGPDGPQWPVDSPPPVRRTYTPHSVDTAARTLAVDFALHDAAGPASTWAAAAEPGDEVVITGGRGAYRLDPAADWTLLVADETALPAVATILADAPAGARVLLVAEVAGLTEHRGFTTRAELTTTWRHPSGGAAGAAAAEAVETLALPSGAGRGWVGLEATAMRRVRRHLLGGRGLDRAALHTRAYWKDGAANHPDHDSGEDD